MNAPAHRQEPVLLPIDSITVVAGFNPRRHFAADALNTLVESIRSEGLMTSITVRVLDEGGYALIAGERRLRACRQLGLTEIPALVFDVDDVTAKRMALAENAVRRDLHPAEEAMSAQAHLDAYEGDHAAAAAALGWTTIKLKHRVQLLRADQSVLDALMADEITIGHAELLASLPLDRQTKALPKILSEGITVAQLKEQLQGFAIPLSTAIFDRAGCIGCPNNSSTQRDFFSDVIADDRCTNKLCFGDKTLTAVAAKRDALKDDFGSVALVTEKPAGSFIALTADGQKGIGAEQFSACRGCAFRGAMVEDRMGPTVGQVTSPLCFNLVCHSEKLVVRKAEQEAARTAAAAEAANANASVKSAVTSAPRGSTSPTPARVTAAPKKAAAAVVAVSGQVMGQHRAIVRRAVSEAARTNVNVVLAFAAFAVATLHKSGAGSAIDKALTGAGLAGSDAFNASKCIGANVNSPRVDLQTALVRLVETFFTVNPDHVGGFGDSIKRDQVMARLVKELGLDLTPHVVIDKPFLSAHTKDAIDAILDESGFKKWLTEQPDGAKKLKAITGGAKSVLVDGVLAAGFDFAGYRPSTLATSLKAFAK